MGFEKQNHASAEPLLSEHTEVPKSEIPSLGHSVNTGEEAMGPVPNVLQTPEDPLKEIRRRIGPLLTRNTQEDMLPLRSLVDNASNSSSYHEELGVPMDSLSLPAAKYFVDEDVLIHPEENWAEWLLKYRKTEETRNHHSDEEYQGTREKHIKTILAKERKRYHTNRKSSSPPQEIELVVDISPVPLIASSHKYQSEDARKEKTIQPHVGVTGHPIICFPPYTWRIFFAHLLPILLALLSIIIFAMPLPIMNEIPEARKCLGILIAVAILWSTEAIPIFITALLIPILVVLLQVLVSGTCSNSLQATVLTCTSDNVCRAYAGTNSTCEYLVPLSRYETAMAISQQYYSPIVFLILGVFAIAAALRKTELDHRLSRFVLRWAGTRPAVIMLVMMLLGWFLSMWVSNITAAVITISLVSPILKTLPSEESYSRCVLLGIAFTCNIAGMTTPIASPQNLLAINSLTASTTATITFPEWIAVASTTSLIAVFCIFFFCGGSSNRPLLKLCLLHCSHSPLERSISLYL